MRAAIRRILSEGHRVFFLAASLFAVVSGVVWGTELAVDMAGDTILDLPHAMAPPLWHAHEMVFGFAGAAVAGFLLTAVPNWTDTDRASPGFVGAVAALWLAGRLAIWRSAALPAGVVAATDLAFLPVLTAQLGRQLAKRPRPRSLIFLLFLSLFWVGNLLTHLEWSGLTDDTLLSGLHGGLLTLCALMSVLGGRVTPAFTRNAMRRAGEPEARSPTNWPWVERAAIPLALFLPLPILAGFPVWAGPLALALGAVQILRLTGWRPIWALRQPILIALHGGMAMLGLGLALWGAAVLGWGNEVAALHVLGIGAVGGMTLAVMSRAVLGHSGRPVRAPGPLVWAYALMPLSAALRWWASSIPGPWSSSVILLSAGLWCVAFGLFLIALWPALTGPRQPG